MNRLWTYAARLTLLVPILLPACAGSRSQLPVQTYVPANEAMIPLGELHLSNTLLQFERLDAEMKLAYAGTMPESAGPALAGALIYRVKNAEAYFEKNAGKNAFCSEAPLWVAVNSATGAPGWSNRIWLGLLTLEDWTQFNPRTNRACAGGDYVRAAD
jgi:hypothetical protein